jgi:hypothetical protein
MVMSFRSERCHNWPCDVTHIAMHPASTLPLPNESQGKSMQERSSGEGRAAPATAPVARVPHLVRFLGLHMASGLAIGVVIASLMILSNLAGLKDLLVEAQEPFIAIFLLYAFNALTFGSVAMGIAVMTMPYDGICDMRDPGDGDDRGPLR